MKFSKLSDTLQAATKPIAGTIHIPKTWAAVINDSPLLTVVAVLLLIVVSVIFLRILYAVFMKSFGIIKFTLSKRNGKNKPLTIPDISLDPISRVIKAIKYLTKRKEWRYATPWYLLTGDMNSNKDDLIESLDSGRRQSLLLKEKQLAVNDTGWHFFNNGIVINVDDDIFDRNKQKDTRWEHILSGIAANRPERPADGIIVTISAETLMENRKLLKESGHLFYKRLLKLQEIFVFSLPVYLVVTGCETVEGFASFWNAQEKQHLQEMFGWSNPFHSDVYYLPEWVDLAFDQIFSRLQDAQINSVASQKASADPDGFFLFPYYFRKLRNPLKEFTSTIFNPSSYHASFQLRGIYFTGLLDDTEKENDEVKRIHCFSRDLFERKIFAEQNLAVPTEKGIISRNRIIRNFQFTMIGISVFLFSVFIINETSLIHRVNKINEVADVIQKGVKDCSNEGSRVYDILDKLTEIEADTLYFSFIKSWYDRLPEKIGKYIAEECLTQSVYKSLECRLEKKALNLNETLSDSSQDYDSFLTTLEDLKAFEINLKRFMVLCSSNENESDQEVLDNFGKLIAYLYTGGIPDSLTGKTNHQVYTLKKIRYTPSWYEIKANNQDAHYHELNIYRPESDREKLLAPIPKPDDVITRINTIVETIESPLYEQLQIPTEINEILNQTKTGILPVSAAELMDKWIDGVVDSNWMKPKQESPCLQLENVIDTANISLKKAGYNTVIGDLDYLLCYSEAKHILLAQSISPEGQLFSENADGSFEMKKNTLMNRTALADLLKTEFMQFPVKEITYRSGEPSAWDQSKLTQAIKLYREYKAFIAGHAHETGQALFYETIAEKQIRMVMTQLVYEAQVGRGEIVHAGPVYMPVDREEAFLSADIANFDSVVEEIKQILSILNDNQFNYQKTDLLNAATDYCISLLEKSDSLVNTGRLYQPVPDPEWTTMSLSTVLYNLDTQSQIKEYLKAQKSRVQYISLNYAQPVVQFLLNITNIQATKRFVPFNRWYNTLMEIDKYQKHDPESHLAILENYFSRTLSKETVKTYTPQKAQKPSGVDLFSTSITSIETTILTKVTGVESKTVETSYDQLAERFNTDLTSHFPFTGSDTPDGEDVDIDVLSKFVDDYKKTAGEIEDTLSYNAEATYSGKAKTYLEQMDAVVDFFDKALNTVGKEPGALVVKPEFRVFSQQYDGSNQIVEWKFKSGMLSSGYPSTGAVDTLYWQNGDPVELTLRWAKGSDFKPVGNGGTGTPDIKDRTVSYSYEGNLNLVKFLIDHRESDHPELKNNTDVLTSFDVPVVNTECNEKEDDCNQTIRLYINFKLYAKNPKTDSWETVSLPNVFPAHAPELKQPTLVE